MYHRSRMVSTPSATVRGSSDKKKLHCIAGNILCESRERKGENVQDITKLLLPKCEHRQSMSICQTAPSCGVIYVVLWKNIYIVRIRTAFTATESKAKQDRHYKNTRM